MISRSLAMEKASNRSKNYWLGATNDTFVAASYFSGFFSWIHNKAETGSWIRWTPVSFGRVWILQIRLLHSTPGQRHFRPCKNSDLKIATLKTQKSFFLRTADSRHFFPWRHNKWLALIESSLPACEGLGAGERGPSGPAPQHPDPRGNAKFKNIRQKIFSKLTKIISDQRLRCTNI